MANAFELLVGRQLITRDECAAILQQLQDDIERGRLLATDLDLEQAFAETAELAQRQPCRP